MLLEFQCVVVVVNVIQLTVEQPSRSFVALAMCTISNGKTKEVFYGLVVYTDLL